MSGVEGGERVEADAGVGVGAGVRRPAPSRLRRPTAAAVTRRERRLVVRWQVGHCGEGEQVSAVEGCHALSERERSAGS